MADIKLMQSNLTQYDLVNYYALRPMHCGNTRHLTKHKPRLLTAQSLPVDVVESSCTALLIFVTGLCTDFVATVINPCCLPR